MTAYAEGTTVKVEASQQEIAGTLRRYGAEGFMFGWEGGRAAISFLAHGRRVRFIMPLPTDDDVRRTGKGRVRTGDALATAKEAEERRRWRALAMAIKAKLEVVASGIATFEDEFLAHVLLPDGTTVGDHVRPELEVVYASGQMPKTLLALEA